MSERKCDTCKEFYACRFVENKSQKENDRKWLCSVCFARMNNSSEVTMLDWKVELAEFLKEHNLQHVIPSEAKFKMLCRIARGKTPMELSLLLDGFTDLFPPTVLLSSQGDQLLQQALHENAHKPGILYQFAHAIYYYVVDPWNHGKNAYTNGIVKCYYQELGDLVTCPLLKSKLHSLWSDLKTFRTRDLDATPSTTHLGSCCLCESKVMLNQAWARCRSCLHIMHVSCGLPVCCPNGECKQSFTWQNKNRQLQIYDSRCRAVFLGDDLQVCVVHGVSDLFCMLD
jgi:hypothetical protein